MLAQNIQLALEVLRIKRSTTAGVTVAVVRAQDYERLQNSRLLARRGGTQDGPVRGYLSPAQDTEPQIVRNLGEDGLLLLQADRIVRLEEDVTDGVLAELGKLAADVPLSLTLEEQMRNTSHDTGTISISTVCTSGTTMGHGTQQLTSIGDDLVGLFALDVTNETYTTGIFLVLVIVQTLTGW